jgi:hypothetical protein
MGSGLVTTVKKKIRISQPGMTPHPKVINIYLVFVMYVLGSKRQGKLFEGQFRGGNNTYSGESRNQRKLNW